MIGWLKVKHSLFIIRIQAIISHHHFGQKLYDYFNTCYFSTIYILRPIVFINIYIFSLMFLLMCVFDNTYSFSSFFHPSKKIDI